MSEQQKEAVKLKDFKVRLKKFFEKFVPERDYGVCEKCGTKKSLILTSIRHAFPFLIAVALFL